MSSVATPRPFRPHGKSKYAQKRQQPKAQATRIPVRTYLSNCCDVPGFKSRAETKEVDQVSIGKWRCSACKKRCTVKVKHVAEAPVEAVASVL